MTKPENYTIEVQLLSSRALAMGQPEIPQPARKDPKPRKLEPQAAQVIAPVPKTWRDKQEQPPEAFASVQCKGCFKYYDLAEIEGHCPECGSDEIVGVD